MYKGVAVVAGARGGRLSRMGMSLCQRRDGTWQPHKVRSYRSGGGATGKSKISVDLDNVDRIYDGCLVDWLRGVRG